MEKMWQGLGVVPGIAIGRVKLVSSDLTAALEQYTAGSRDEENAKLTAALATADAELGRLAAQARQSGQPGQAEIMEAHQAMASDPELLANTGAKISQGIPAPQAVLAATTEFAAVFSGLDDLYFQERAADLRDIGRRISRILTGGETLDFGFGPVVLCTEEIEPSLAAAMPAGQVVGIVLGQGSRTSHTIIIAKARGIPAVAGLGASAAVLPEGAEIVVDGDNCQVLLNPPASKLAEVQAKIAAEQERQQQDGLLADLPAVTPDGRTVQLAANIGGPADMTAALKQGCEGVGLFRSEFLFMGREYPPDEEEQFKAYRQVIEQCGVKPCIIRTMDIGGDKPLPYLHIGKEDNPFLGLRAIRVSLAEPALFLTQLKAILRAGVYGRAAVMLPMVISAAEIRRARQYLSQARAELEQQGKAYAPAVELGIMIETPAAAVMASELAAECDFFSIGTNDLVQYTLAVDRGNTAVSSLYSHFHPAVLRLIDGVIKAAHARDIWVGMCGEMAGDPLAAPLLTAMGIDELSMSAPLIPRVKAVIRQLKLSDATAVLAQALSQNNPQAVQSLMTDFLAGRPD